MRFKVICVGYKQNYERYFTVGKVYEWVDGKLTCDDGYTFENMVSGTDPNAWDLSVWYEFEKVEDYSVGDRVRYVKDLEEGDRKLGYYPPVGTLGTITDIRRWGAYVKWDSGTKDGERYTLYERFEKVEETEIKVGDRVRYIHTNSRVDIETGYYPPKGTLGTVEEFEDEDGTHGAWVKWDSGTKDDGVWWASFKRIEKVEETAEADAWKALYETLKATDDAMIEAVKAMAKAVQCIEEYAHKQPVEENDISDAEIDELEKATITCSQEELLCLQCPYHNYDNCTKRAREVTLKLIKKYRDLCKKYEEKTGEKP